MIEIPYPLETKKKINKLKGRISLIESASLSYSEAKDFLNNRFRESFNILLNERNVLYLKAKLNAKNFVNLTQLETRKKLEKDYVVIKVYDFVTPIKIAEGVIISDDFINYNYCIVKEGTSQYIDYACKFDKDLYMILKRYCVLRNGYKIKVGDKVKIKNSFPHYIVQEIIGDKAIIKSPIGKSQSVNKSALTHADIPKFEKITSKKITL